MTQSQLPGLVAARRYMPDWKAFQKDIVDLAHVAGYMVAQFRALQTKHGWRTPVSADGEGWPDFVLIGRGRCLFREAKTGTGRLTDAQTRWITHMRANGLDADVWRPRDMEPSAEYPQGRIAAELGLEGRIT